MPRVKKPPKPRPAGWARLKYTKWFIPVLAGVAFFLIASSGFLFAAHTEENDAFCASCHTQPETAYYQRTLVAKPVDLAASHAAKSTPVRCIDCHSAPGLTGRISAMSLGVSDAIKWYSGSAIQPALLTAAIGDANCLVCHQNTATTTDFNKHYHRFLARWQRADPTAAACVTCHTAHTTGGDPSIGFVQAQRATKICQDCHRALGVGD